MQDRSAPKNKPTTTIVEPSTESARDSRPLLTAEGPKTDKREERTSITQLLSEKLKSLMTPTETATNLEKHADNKTILLSEAALNEAIVRTCEPKGFLAVLREQKAKFFQIKSVTDLLTWTKDTIQGLIQSAAFNLRWVSLGRESVHVTTSSPTTTIDSPASTTHGFTAAPTILEREKDIESQKAHPTDYTAEGVIAVAEATRKEAEEKKQNTERRRAEELDHKRRVRAEVLAIDARVGGENPELQAIIDQLDGVYGSLEVALRSIMEAQAKEMGVPRKKVA